MAQEYKNNPLSLNHLLIYGSGAAIQLAVLYRLALDHNKALWEIQACLGAGILIIGFFQYLAWQSGKTTVVISDDRLILRQFHKSLEARWDDIQSIRKLFTIYAGYSYLVKTKQGTTLGIPDTIERCAELIREISRRAHVPVKWTL